LAVVVLLNSIGIKLFSPRISLSRLFGLGWSGFA
jgi:hypothetical protein